MFVLVGCISASPFRICTAVYIPRSMSKNSNHSTRTRTSHTRHLHSPHSPLNSQTCGPPPPIAFACRARLSASVLYVPPMGESETSGDGSVLIIGDAPIPGVASGAE